MKALALSILLAALSIFSLRAGDYEACGPQGKLSYKISVPKGFDPGKDRCSMVILMHGIFSSKDYNPMPAIAKGLAKAGIVPMWCSERYKEVYGDPAELIVVDGENHTITRRRRQVVSLIVDFFKAL